MSAITKSSSTQTLKIEIEMERILRNILILILDVDTGVTVHKERIGVNTIYCKFISTFFKSKKRPSGHIEYCSFV